MMRLRASTDAWELRHGIYQKVMRDVRCDTLIADPPFSEKTHSGQRHGRKDPAYTAEDRPILSSRGLSFEHWTPEDVVEFCDFFHPRTRGWFCALTSHDLYPVYRERLEHYNRYVFHPIPCTQKYRNVRLGGDGPASWTDWLVVARPRNAEFIREECRALPGDYTGPAFDAGATNIRGDRMPGGKPIWMMRAIARDYSLPGQRICDPTAGEGTTLLAAIVEKRTAIGSEMRLETYNDAVARLESGYTPAIFELDPETHAAADARLQRGYTPALQFEAAPKATQNDLFED